jgi:hypothetical protein
MGLPGSAKSLLLPLLFEDCSIMLTTFFLSIKQKNCTPIESVQKKHPNRLVLALYA